MKEETLVKLSDELETCGKALLKIAETMKFKEEAPAPEPPKNKVVPTKLTLEEVRELIQKYGADKLSTMDPEKYGAFLKDLKVMDHAG